MAVDPMTAAAAYRQGVMGGTAIEAGGIVGNAGTPSSGSSFVDMVRGVTQDAIDTNYRAETIAARGIAGQATVTEVVTAIAEAESTLNTVVTVRDRVISAYQEILRMPI